MAKKKKLIIKKESDADTDRKARGRLAFKAMLEAGRLKGTKFEDKKRKAEKKRRSNEDRKTKRDLGTD